MATVGEIMTKDPACCDPDTSLQDVARMMADNDCGEIPVVESLDDPKPVGVVTDRDITCRAVAEGRNPLKLSAKDCMSTPAITVRPDTTLDECCDILERRQIRRVPVVDEDGRLCGMVSQADIALHAGSDKTAEVVREVSQHAHA